MELINSKIVDNGKNNKLIADDNVKLVNSVIRFRGDNSTIHLSSNVHNYYIDVTIYSDCNLTIGENCYFNETGQIGKILVNEHQSVTIGKDCLFSTGYSIETGDVHTIYSCDTHERLNESKSIKIGDHVWICRNVSILKGCNIGSGSIIGKNSTISNKKVGNNESWAGNPAKLIRKGVFFVHESSHNWTEEQTKKKKINPTTKYIFK